MRYRIWREWPTGVLSLCPYFDDHRPLVHLFRDDDLDELAEQLIDVCHYGRAVGPSDLVALVVRCLRNHGQSD